MPRDTLQMRSGRDKDTSAEKGSPPFHAKLGRAVWTWWTVISRSRVFQQTTPYQLELGKLKESPFWATSCLGVIGHESWVYPYSWERA